MTGIFITATGTDIGKTYITRKLLQYDQYRYKHLTASKPVITGWPVDEKNIYLTDTYLLLEAQKVPFSADACQHYSPWRFFHPLTPSMAAAKEGKVIEIDALLQHCLQWFAKARQAQKIHLIEGVAGAMAPLATRYTMLDWISQLKCPCLVVAGTYLGSLSHTLTTIEVIQQRGVPILALIVNETPNGTVPLREVCDCLASFLPEIKIIALPYGPSEQIKYDPLSLIYAALFPFLNRSTVSLKNS